MKKYDVKTCKICNRVFSTNHSIYKHLRCTENIKIEEYFNKFIMLDEKEKYCNVCGNHNKFISLTKGYTKQCCKKCKCINSRLSIKNHPKKTAEHRKFLSNLFKGKSLTDLYGEEKAREIRLKQRNSKNKFNSSDKGREIIKASGVRISEALKNKILFGGYSPKSSNRFTRKNKVFNNIDFRSSWEIEVYKILIKNYNNVLYENVRIPYMDTERNIERIYIVDFFVPHLKLLIEVKPNKFISSINFINKLQGMKKYCELNNYDYILISEDFMENDIFVEKKIIDKIEYGKNYKNN